MRKLPVAFAVVVTISSALVAFAGCGSEANSDLFGVGDGGAGEGGSSSSSSSGAPTDGSAPPDGSSSTSSGGATDASLNDAAVCKLTGQSCALSGECCTGNCDSTSRQCVPPLEACREPGTACSAPNQCCTGSCVNGSCANKQCVPDKPTAGACGQDGDCCSGICSGGTCASLNGGGSCRTAGNPCSANGDCCSKLCNNGICSSAVSFCTQKGDICSSNSECCSGNCQKQGTNITGLCGDPTAGGGVPAGCMPSGTVCGGGAGEPIMDAAGLLPCDQSCCSRSCGYFGARSGFRVCQPPSGCHPTGEVCRNDSDCCGWSGSPAPLDGPVSCSKSSPTAEFGRCDNGGACREPGSICAPGAGDSCSAENNCCEHSSLPSSFCNSGATREECCKRDSLGIPRCLIKPVDCSGAPPPAGTTCATSADCCGNPCIGNKCLASGGCQQQGLDCTNSADCCAGIECVKASGAARGICGGTLLPDGGVSDAGGGTTAPDAGGGGTCALYGQLCSVSGDCCNGVPCTLGRCRLD